MGIIIGTKAIDVRLEQFKKFKAARAAYGRPFVSRKDRSWAYLEGKPVFLPDNPLLAGNTFDFPADDSDLRGKVAWADLKKLRRDARIIKAAHEVIRLRHTGWYGNVEFAEELLVGHVMQLPGKNRKERWLALVVVSDYDSVRVEIDEIYESAEDAAHAADESARIQAEKCNEFREQEEAKAKEAASKAAKELDSEAAWALKKLAEAMVDDPQFVKPTLLAMTLGIAPEDCERMLKAFAMLKAQWVNVEISLPTGDFYE